MNVMKDRVLNNNKNNKNIHKEIKGCVTFFPLGAVSSEELANIAYLCCFSDKTKMSQCIVNEAQSRFNIKAYDKNSLDIKFVQYKEKTKMSGVNFRGSIIRKGEAEAVKDYFFALGHSFPDECEKIVDHILEKEARPLVIAKDGKVMGVIAMKESGACTVSKTVIQEFMI